MDHGVRGPDCDHCKRALGPLYHHKIAGNRHLPVFTFDFSGPHPHRVNVAQYLLVSVWSLGHMRLIWAFGVESRQASVVLPCLQSCFEDLRALTGGSRPPILRLHSDKAREFLSPTIRAYLSQQAPSATDCKFRIRSTRQWTCRMVDWHCQSKSHSSPCRRSASTGLLVLRL